jgi:hypothetical protein
VGLNVFIDVSDLREEAAEARDLASILNDPSAVPDLLKYASALESDASRWGLINTGQGPATPSVGRLTPMN